jgi:hypothetical protein
MALALARGAPRRSSEGHKKREIRGNRYLLARCALGSNYCRSCLSTWVAAAIRQSELGCAERHLARLREGRPESIETSSLHLDILRDLKRIHSHIRSVAYPVLEAAGVLQPSRGLSRTGCSFSLSRPIAPRLAFRRCADCMSVDEHLGRDQAVARPERSVTAP